jgi:cytoskeletal protein CcmA (bactofilin family)
MFKSKSSKMNPNTTDTLIGEGTIFEGKLKSDAGIRIEGQITGNVESAGDVTVGEKGVVKSNISARNVIIAGTVHGNVLTKGSLRIMSSGRVYGNTTSQSLVIDEGGIFQGNSRMEVKTGEEDKAKQPDPNQQQQQQQHVSAPGFSSGYSSSPSPL